MCTVAANCLAGEQGDAAGEFGLARDVATGPTGDVFVVDYGNDRIVKFGAAGNFLLAWGRNVNNSDGDTGTEICTVPAECQTGAPGSAGGEFDQPQYIATDSTGNVYVRDNSARVQKFDSTGHFLRAWGKGVNGGSGFEVCTVASQCTGGLYGDSGGELPTPAPAGIAVSASGDVFVADIFRIQKFDSSGNFLRAWGKDVVKANGETGFETCTVAANCKGGEQGTLGGELYQPFGVAVDPTGAVYVTDSVPVFGMARVQKYDSSGNFLRAWGGNVDGSNPGTGPEICTVAANCLAGTTGVRGGEFAHPVDITVDAAGGVYTSEADNWRIQKFDASGNFLRTWGRGVQDGAASFQICTTAATCTQGSQGGLGGEMGAPWGIGAGPGSAGNLYVGDNKRVQKFTGPEAPSVTSTSPQSPANQNKPKVRGTADTGSTVTIFTDSTCTTSVATGAAADFASPGLEVTVANDSFTTFYAAATAGGHTSPCSATGVTYIEDSTPPGAPTISGTVPVSPASDRDPEVKGSAVSGTTVDLFTNMSCAGTPVESGSAADFADPGITVSVPADTSTTLYASARDAAGNPSPCSSGVPYTHITVPAAAITAGPSGPTDDSTPTFSFTASPAAGVTFQCWVDGAAPAACSSPFTTAALDQGAHEFNVRSVKGGATSSPASRSFFVDTVAPTATITVGPVAGFGTRIGTGETYAGLVAIGRTASDPDPGSGVLEVRCVLDPAAPPATIDDMPTSGCLSTDAVGSHTFYAASRDNAGNAETPVAHHFTILGPPETTITGGPSGVTWNSTPSFTFSSSVAGSTFRCRVDNGAPVSCSSPFTTSPLGTGGHFVDVAAINPDGVADPTPARRAFSVAPQETHGYHCEVNPYVEHYGVDSGRGIFGCAIVHLGQRCPDHTNCVPTTDTCPVGARCTVITRASWSDADHLINWLVRAEVREPVSGNLVTGTDYCATEDHHRCSPSASASFLGRGSLPVYLLCSSVTGTNRGVYGGLAGDPSFGPASTRKLFCDSTLTIAPAATLATTTQGTSVNVYAPGAGAVGITAAGFSAKRRAGTVTAAARRKTAPFKPGHRTVRTAGPVTFNLKLSKAASKTFKRKKKLVLSVRESFKPTHGKTVTKTRKITLKPRPKPPTLLDIARARCAKDPRLRRTKACRGL